MIFSVNIHTGNAAFEGDPGPELASILIDLANRLNNVPLECDQPIRLRDVNGNRVGFAVLAEEVPA